MTNPDNSNIDEQVKAFYQNLRMDDAKAKALLDLSGARATESSTTSQPEPSRRQFLMAASMGGVMIATGAGYGLYQWQDRKHRSRLSSDVQLITELVTNHRNRVPLDVISESVPVIAEALDKVSFNLALPDRLLAQADVIGGRYCSLLGESAIQVRLKASETQRDMTVFVTTASPRLLHFDGIATQTEDLTITANRYNDLLVTVVKER